MTNRVIIPKGDPSQATSVCWFLCEGDVKPTLRCECGEIAHMSNHKVSAAGVVTASIACHRCDYHVWGTLEGWEGGDV